MKKPDKHRIAQRLTRGARDRKGQARVVSAKPKRHRAQIPYPTSYLGFGALLAAGAAFQESQQALDDGLFRTLRHPGTGHFGRYR